VICVVRLPELSASASFRICCWSWRWLSAGSLIRRSVVISLLRIESRCTLVELLRHVLGGGTMSHQAIAAVLARTDLSVGERLVAFSLASFADRENVARPASSPVSSWRWRGR
jgi:hypothetical protein